MKLIERTGDLFSYDGVAIGHGVNCQGVMGGIAAEFSKRYPEMYTEYKQFCDDGKLTPGMVHLYTVSNDRVVVNLATQNYPGPEARLSWVAMSLSSFARLALDWKTSITEIAIPRVGCGIGGLKWWDVKPTIKQLRPAEFTVVVYTLEGE